MDTLWIEVDGKPVRAESVEQWGQWWRGADRRVAQDDVNHYTDWWVSTVFLGVDYSFTWDPRDPRPILYETAVFRRRGVDEDMQRYATREEALAGHRAMLERWRAVPLWRELWWIFSDAVEEAMQPPQWLTLSEVARYTARRRATIPGHNAS